MATQDPGSWRHEHRIRSVWVFGLVIVSWVLVAFLLDLVVSRLR